MNQRRHLTLVASAAALLASLPLAAVFEAWSWLIDAFLVVAVVCGVAMLVRSLRVPIWAPTAAMAGAALLALTWLFPSNQEFLGIFPTPATFAHFADLLGTASTEMSEFAAPVTDRDGFLFLSTLGIAGVAVVIDLFAVVLRRPALAGLPMLAIYSVPVAVSETSVNPLPFALGAIGFLWLLVTDNVDRVRRFGRRFTGDGRDVDLWEPSPLAAAGQRLGVVGVVAAVVLPLFVPGMTGGLLERFGSGTGPGMTNTGGGGRSVSIFAMLSGELSRDRAIDMLKVTNVNDPNPFYLRFAVADDLTTQGFRPRPNGPGQPINNGIPGAGWGPAVTSKSYKANIEVLGLDVPYLPVYTQPTKVEKFDNNWVYDRNTGMIYSTTSKQSTKKRKYSVEYARPEFSADDLRRARPLRADDPVMIRYTSVPSVTAVKALVKPLIEGKQTQYDKVNAIFNFFSTDNDFRYDTTTGAETSGTKIVDFLDNKRGFCVQYAAAMGWLLREAKIPSRVAFGFTRGGAKQGNTLTLTNFNLHAWTEVYFPEFGWVPFDPTPASAIGGSVSPSWAPNPSQLTTSDPNEDDGPLPGQSGDADPSAAATDPAGDPGAGDTGAGGGSGDGSLLARMKVALVTGGGSLAVLLLLATPALSRLATRRRRLRFRAAGVVARGDSTGPPEEPGRPVVLPEHDAVYVATRDDAHQAWDELLDTMIDYRVTIDEAETPRATGARLVARERLKDEAQAAVRLLSTAEEHARYARRPLTGGEMRSSLDAVRRALSSRVGRRTRIMAWLLPPSVLQRWRIALSRTFVDVANGLGQRRDTVVRTVSIRRLMTKRAR